MALETLEILIEADRSGLESQLKRAAGSIQSFVSSMNKQEVNWTSILSRTISPAIISGIAGMFALGITQAVQFQQQVAQAGAAGSDSFGNSIGGLTSDFYSLGNSVGQTGGDIASAMAIASKYFSGNIPVMEALTSAAGMLATMGFGTLSDNTLQLSQTMSNWGLTTVPQVQTAIDGLWEASKTGKITFGDLLGMIESSGTALQGVTTIQEVSKSIEGMSNVAGQTKDSVTTTFSAIVAAATDPLNSLNLILDKNGDILKTINTEGVKGAFLEIANYIDEHPRVAATVLGKEFGLTSAAVTAFRISSVADIQKIMDQEDLAIAKAKTLNDSYKTALQEDPTLGKWAQIKNLFGELIGGLANTAADTAIGSLEYLNALKKDPLQTLKDTYVGAGIQSQENMQKLLTPANNNVSTNVTINQNIANGSAESVAQGTTKGLQDSMHGLPTK